MLRTDQKTRLGLDFEESFVELYAEYPICKGERKVMNTHVLNSETFKTQVQHDYNFTWRLEETLVQKLSI